MDVYPPKHGSSYVCIPGSFSLTSPLQFFRKQGFHAAGLRPLRGAEQALQPGPRHAVDGNFPGERVRGPQEPHSERAPATKRPTMGDLLLSYMDLKTLKTAKNMQKLTFS